jgi:hypothetical protein
MARVSHVTLTVTVIVRKKDLTKAKEALTEALTGDFDSLCSTVERRATDVEIRLFQEEFDGAGESD